VAAARALRNLLAHMEPQIAAAALVESSPGPTCYPSEIDSVRDRLRPRLSRLRRRMGQWTPLAQTVREWKATAAVHADPELVEQLTSPVSDDFGAVPDPTEH